MNNKPNIVFFFTDDQRFDTIHALGNDAIMTPNMDKLVKRGVSFTHAHIPCGTSGAVCMPSRAMLNSGRSLFHIEDAGQSIPKDHTTIGQALRENGYRTFGTGKWHNGAEAFNRSFTDGAEIFFGGMADHWNVPAYNYDPTGKYDKTCPIIKDPGYKRDVEERHCDHIHAGKHSSELVCDAAINFINECDEQTPFYSYISFLAPHDPRSMPEEFKKMYDPAEVTLPDNFLGGHPFDTGALNIRDEMLAAFPRTPEETRVHIAEYYAMITHLDYQLGRVMETLEQKGVLDNTIIVFAGDNGLAVGQHGLFGKQSCYDHSVRVPLLFSGPGIPEDTIRESQCYLFDIFPTLCDLSDTAIPESVEGKSLVAAMNTEQEVRDELYFAYCNTQRAVKKDNYKLVEYVIDGKHIMTQLFDLKNDSNEISNLAFNEDYQDKVKSMQANLKELASSWDDTQSPWGKTFWQGYENKAVYPVL